MRMRACRKFQFSSQCCDLALEVRFAPAIVSPLGPVGTVPTSQIVLCANEDPLPDPEPAPGLPGTPPTPTSGPIGPGTS
jgi:hypothetical protein